MALFGIEHDRKMVGDLADRIHVLDYGRTIANGEPEAVLKDPEVLRAYMGPAA
jgi:branched-chain amino acid transport system ATP-binding protein